jgi:hypothetical protein
MHSGGSQNENPEIPYQIEQFKPDSSEKVICFVIPQKEDTRLDASSGKMVPENLPREEDIRISLLDDRSLAKHPEDKKKSATVKSDIKVILVGNDDDENRVAGRHRKTKTAKEDMRINHKDNLAKRKRNRKQTDQQEHTYEKKKTPMHTVRSTSKSSFRKRVGDA